MSESQGENPKPDSEVGKSNPQDAKKAIRRNLNNFLNPGLPVPKAAPADPNGAARLRMAQMELANRMRLAQGQQGPTPPRPPSKQPPATPPGGFGFHMQAGNFGQRKPTVSKRSPYQQIFANASKKPEEVEKVEESGTDSKDQPAGEDVIEVPKESEVRQGQTSKRRAKKFRNPSL